jgi:DNA-binding CsgD family transcriptional regulator
MIDYFRKSDLAIAYAKAMRQKMQAIARPLFLNTEINSFSYIKFFKDGTVLNLSTDMQWIEFRFEAQIPYRILFEDHLKGLKLNQPHIYLWPTKANSPLLAALKSFEIWNGCNIYITNKEYIEVFSFASAVENINLQNYCINHFDLLKGFIVSFKHEMLSELGCLRKENKIIADVAFPDQLREKPSVMGESYFSFTKKPKKIRLNDRVILSLKECQCVHLLLAGNTAKEIASQLYLSPRTVETHLNNVKDKTGSSTKSQLTCYLADYSWVIESVFL